ASAELLRQGDHLDSRFWFQWPGNSLEAAFIRECTFPLWYRRMWEESKCLSMASPRLPLREAVTKSMRSFHTKWLAKAPRQQLIDLTPSRSGNLPVSPAAPGIFTLNDRGAGALRRAESR